MSDASLRAALCAGGARGAVLDELLVYARVAFTPDAGDDLRDLPLPDEPFVESWVRYSGEADRSGAWPVLRERLVQLRFPIRDGISADPAYLAATRRGVIPTEGEGLVLNRPDAIRLWLHPTVVGRLPVVLVPDRHDFVALVRALSRRNEPAPVPASMGACIVSGYNNWDRIAALRRAWQAGRASASDADWMVEFRRIAARKELYQDRFVLLSAGGYSGVSAAALGLDPEEWLRISLVIRLEHECTHYVTRRLFGSMRNSLHDELMADYAGIVAATGEFRADWFLRFLGLEAFPDFRAGGRLENYRGDPPLSDAAFAVLGGMVVAAAERLQRIDRELRAGESTPVTLAGALRRLARTSLPEIGLSGPSHLAAPTLAAR